MAQRLQNRLQLAHFKVKHGLVDVALDMIETKFEQEMDHGRSDLDIGPSNGSVDDTILSPKQRDHGYPSEHTYFSGRHLYQSSLKPKWEEHFTTPTGPNVFLYSGLSQISDVLTTTKNDATTSCLLKKL